MVIPSIVLHEISHGAVALAFGDDTADRAGRLSLNPIRHVDPVGTLVLPAVLALSGAGVFGYAKPVPINPARMRHPRNDGLVVSLAGPACNLFLAALSVAALRGRSAPDPRSSTSAAWPLDERLVFLFGFVNVTLAGLQHPARAATRRLGAGGPAASRSAAPPVVFHGTLRDADPPRAGVDRIGPGAVTRVRSGTQRLLQTRLRLIAPGRQVTPDQVTPDEVTQAPGDPSTR